MKAFASFVFLWQTLPACLLERGAGGGVEINIKTEGLQRKEGNFSL